MALTTRGLTAAEDIILTLCYDITNGNITCVFSDEAKAAGAAMVTGLVEKNRCDAPGANLRCSADGPRAERQGVKREHGETLKGRGRGCPRNCKR